MTKIKEILKWLNIYTAAVASAGIGVFFLFDTFQRPNLNTADKKMTLEGNIRDYSFKYNSGYRATLKEYYIWLDNYPCTFQIKADFLPYFYQSKFETEIKNGDKIKLVIPKEFENQLWNSENNVFIFSASKNSNEYLILEETIRKDSDNFMIYSGLLFIIAGGVIYYVIKKRNEKKT